MNELIERLFAVRNEIASLKRMHLKDLEDEKKGLETKLFGLLEELGVDGTKVKGVGSVSITEAVVPQADDWDEFYGWVLGDKSRFCLLNRALNAPAFREALVIEGEIPGLSKFTKRSLSVRVN